MKKEKPLWWRWALPVLLLVSFIGLQQWVRWRQGTTFSYSEFREAVAQGRVSSVRISASHVEGRFKDGPEDPGRGFSALRVDDPDLLRELRAQGVKVSGALPELPWTTLAVSVLMVGGIAYLLLTRVSGVGGAAEGYLSAGRSRAKIYAEHDVTVGFADVAGVDEAKEDLAEVVSFLQTPEQFRRLGGKLPKGVLLVGPPGTGKTLLARAVAGEAKVPFFSLSGSEFVEMFVGVGAARVRDLFQQARAQAPCIIFIDELDALGRARNAGPMGHEEREQTLNQLLVEMDGFDPRIGVILMAATNRPEILDPALLRAGRFDRQVLVDRPDRSGRLDILKLHARSVPLEDAGDLERLAGMTVGMVGADLANVINEAALRASRHGQNTVTRADLEEAVERAVAGLQKRHRVLSAQERERVAYHELGHALVGMALSSVGVVQKVSIVPRGTAALGYTLQVPTEDRFLMTRRELEDKIATLLGGRVAEELIFQEVSTGAHDDLLRATDIARSMVVSYGMTEVLGLATFDEGRGSAFLESGPSRTRGNYSEGLARRIDDEVGNILKGQHARVRELLGKREQVLRRAAHTLLQKETLSGEELTALVAAPGSSITPAPPPPNRDAA
ncbi:ATP-dependent zinc metalloprotease FtsH [Hyalangium minutum]|uniref:ATP-dependent zinc metalloprotease FtsH n=1 Tax=Hyalangium minutum TaxID=394096 RepID=A0A085VYW0_9BACT|nr:ATP-dependent zinc metalloprotease FtsH [Hyalangium minutum]KFE60623.1 Cell division protein FtsH [Hyalangium minutum]